MTAVVVFVMTTASLFSWIMAREQVPQRFAEFVTSVTANPAAVLFLINVLVLIMGCFFDGISILVIVVPIFLPILDQMGIDRVHFGVMVVLNTVIGLITPPVGWCSTPPRRWPRSHSSGCAEPPCRSSGR